MTKEKRVKEIFGVKVYQVSDVIAKAGKLKHVSDPRGKARHYSYGGTVTWVKKVTELEPTQRGLCIKFTDVNNALKAIGKPEVPEDMIKGYSICGLRVVNVEEFAGLAGMSPSNVYKKIYHPQSAIAHYFENFQGGWAMTEEVCNEVAARLQSKGSGPRPTRYRRSSGKKKGAGLQYRKIEPALKIEVITKGTEEL